MLNKKTFILGLLTNFPGQVPKQLLIIMKAYEKIASIYDQYWKTNVIKYTSFINMLETKKRFNAINILELACGTGTLIKELANDAKRVVGIDISSSMLDIAKQKCRNQKNVSFIKEDFRMFQLNETFDIILCFYDSLNYIDNKEELKTVLIRVTNHLKNNGYFIFDIINEKSMIERTSKKEGIESEELPFKITSSYNKYSKKSKIIININNNKEIHSQISLEYEDIKEAVIGTNFKIVDVFSNLSGNPIQKNTKRFFFVLKKVNGFGNN